MGELLPHSYWAGYALDMGARLRELRLMRGLSQARLGELAGVSRSLISNIERNAYNKQRVADPTLSTVYRIAGGLHVPPMVLLPGATELVHPGKPKSTHPLRLAVNARWPRRVEDTARFEEEYLRVGAEAQSPKFALSLFDVYVAAPDSKPQQAASPTELSWW